MHTKKLLLGLMMGAVASAPAQSLGLWPNYKNIAINTKASGANVSAHVAKFPVLVRLNATNANDIFTGAAADGSDIRFANAAGQARPFDIESWDAVNKRAAIWVLADSVKGNDSVTTLRIYWGVPGAAAASSPAAVFDTANGFVAVWHMNGSGSEKSVTAHGFEATPVGTAPAVNDSAPVGRGRKFDGTQYFQAIGTASSALNLAADAQYTLSAWVRADSVNPTGGTGHVIVNKGDHQWTLATYSGSGQAPNRWYEITTKANNTWNQTTTAPRSADSYAGLSLNSHVGTWRYMTGTWNGTTPTAAVGRIFVDGKLEHTTTPNITTHANGMNAGRGLSRDVHIGALSNQGAGSTEATGAMERFWIGSLDEIRVSRIARDSSWIRLEFETQKPGASVVVLGATQTQTPSGFAVTYPSSAVTLVKDLVASPLVPSVLGTGTPTSYTVSPALPAGLTLNATSGRIAGRPTAAAAAANYTVKAANATDTSTVVLNIAVVDASNENYATNWSQHATLWLNTQSNGADVKAGVAKFPVLVRLDTTNFNTGFGQAAASGADIRFTKANNTTRLPHQIESWDAVAKKAAVWVLLDTIRPSGIDSLRMHWGNATAPDLSSGPSVFDTTNGFQAVWHMNAASGHEIDATANGFNAVAANAPGTAAGVVGPARTFNGTNQYFSVPNTASGKLNFSQASSYTLSSWINPTAIATGGNTGHKIIDKGDNQYVLATYGPDAESRYWEITIRGNGTWNQCQADGVNMPGPAILASSSVGAWNHLVGTYTGAAVGSPVTQRLYYNGVKVAECPISNESTDGRNENYNVHIGVQAAGTAPGSTFTRHWNGLLDEPRLSSVARSDAWIKLEFENQRAAQKLVAFTRPDTVPEVSLNGAATRLTQGFSVKAAGQGMMFGMATAHEGRAVISLIDMWGRTVWTGAFAPGATRLAWNGTAKGGHVANAGLYVARLTLTDHQGKTVQVYDRKVPLTR